AISEPRHSPSTPSTVKKSATTATRETSRCGVQSSTSLTIKRVLMITTRPKSPARWGGRPPSRGLLFLKSARLARLLVLGWGLRMLVTQLVLGMRQVLILGLLKNHHPPPLREMTSKKTISPFLLNIFMVERRKLKE